MHCTIFFTVTIVDNVLVSLRSVWNSIPYSFIIPLNLFHHSEERNFFPFFSVVPYSFRMSLLCAIADVTVKRVGVLRRILFGEEPLKSALQDIPAATSRPAVHLQGFLKVPLRRGLSFPLIKGVRFFKNVRRKVRDVLIAEL